MHSIHSCKVFCHDVDSGKLEAIGLEAIPSWLSFSFRMDTVDQCKMTTDDDSLPTYNCTTIFCDNGESFIIDTLYPDFERMFIEFNSFMSIDNDLTSDL